MIPLTRRGLLAGAGLGLLAVTSGCGVDPRIHQRTHPDQDVAVWRSELVAALRDATTAAQAQPTGWATGLAATFADHAARLASADPLAGVQADLTPLPRFEPSASPSPVPPEGLDELASTVAETAHAGQQQVEDTGTGLLLSSVEVMAQLVVLVDPAELVAPVPGTAVPSPITLDAETCWRQLVSATDGLVFALGSVLGHTTDAARAGVVADWLGQAQRDQEQVLLAAAAHEHQWTTDPDPSLPADPADVASHDGLIGALELAVMSAWTRIHVLDPEIGIPEAVAHAHRAMRCNTPVPIWPGWA